MIGEGLLSALASISGMTAGEKAKQLAEEEEQCLKS